MFSFFLCRGYLFFGGLIYIIGSEGMRCDSCLHGFAHAFSFWYVWCVAVMA